MTTGYIKEDFVAVYDKTTTGRKRKVTLTFGDKVEVSAGPSGWTNVRVHGYFGGPFDGFVKGTLKVMKKGVLKFSLVDVQQGDGMVLETPKGKIILIDGGDNKLVARHLAARFRHRRTTADDPLEVDAIIVTHGDADHFDGLNKVRDSEKDSRPSKRLFIHPKRIFHNGLVKLPSALPEGDRLGSAVKIDRQRYITALYDDFPEHPDFTNGTVKMNGPFKRWAQTIQHWRKRDPIDVRKVTRDSDPATVFDFFNEEGIAVDILGPFPETIRDPRDNVEKRALRFLHKPPKSAEVHLETGDPDGGAISASHTINGHSIALRLNYGNVRFCLTGDLNQESLHLMQSNLNDDSLLESEIVKAPHHGSHEFDLAALKAMTPVVGIVSSGDESAGKEYIHPRATLMAALGQSMPGNTGVLLVTELAAFFAMRDYAHTRADLAKFFKKNKDIRFTGAALAKMFGAKNWADTEGPKPFFGFERTNFGIIHVRTDGKRVLVFTHSGKKNLNEAYRFEVERDAGGKRTVKFAKQVTTR